MFGLGLGLGLGLVITIYFARLVDHCLIVNTATGKVMLEK